MGFMNCPWRVPPVSLKFTFPKPKTFRENLTEVLLKCNAEKRGLFGPETVNF